MALLEFAACFVAEADEILRRLHDVGEEQRQSGLKSPHHDLGQFILQTDEFRQRQSIKILVFHRGRVKSRKSNTNRCTTAAAGCVTKCKAICLILQQLGFLSSVRPSPLGTPKQVGAVTPVKKKERVGMMR